MKIKDNFDCVHRSKFYYHVLTWKFFISFEFVFVQFLFAGRYKADPRFSWFPIDITLFFFLISFLSGMFILKKNQFAIRRDNISFIVSGLLFFGYCLVSLLWSPGEIYATQKTLYFCILTLWTFLACSLVIGVESVRVVRFFVAWVLMSIWIAIEAYMAYSSSSGILGVGVMGGNYLGVGRTVGPASLLLLTVAIYSNMHKIIKLACLSWVVFGSYILLVIGGRGPFIAVAVPVLLIGLLTFSFRQGVYKNKGFFIIFLIAIFGGFYLNHLLDSDYVPVTLRRLMLLFGNDIGNSAVERLHFIKDSINYWVSAPILGHGIGSWPILNNGSDVRGYPHNVFLEVIVEFGIIGFLLLIGFIVKSISNLVRDDRLRYDPIILAIVMFLMNTFINSLFSGDLPDNRYLFGVLGLTIYRSVGDHI
ncbi:O-antigen ligase family protein [Geothermobacter hydrogeniphilus]|nr:O-antigen ligase family protein [Geothermobacter hydrogeniphilus]